MLKYFFILFFIIFSCKGKDQAPRIATEIIKTSDYQLVKTPKATSLLILFPCFPCDVEKTFKEFKIAEHSIENGFSILSMSFNQRLYLKANEKNELADLLNTIIEEHDLPDKNIFIGGFSSGGNVGLLKECRARL